MMRQNTLKKLLMSIVILVILMGCNVFSTPTKTKTKLIRVDHALHLNGEITIQATLLNYSGSDYPEALTASLQVKYNHDWSRGEVTSNFTNFVQGIGNYGTPKTFRLSRIKGNYYENSVPAFYNVADWKGECPYEILYITVKDRGLAEITTENKCKPPVTKDNQKNNNGVAHPSETEEPMVKPPSNPPPPIVQNENEYCKKLIAPEVLDSVTFGDKFMCGNYILSKSGNHYKLRTRYEVYPTGANVYFGAHCQQIRNLNTGVRAPAHCWVGQPDFRARRDFILPQHIEASSGDTIEIAWFIFSIRLSQNGNSQYVGMDPENPDTYPVTIKGDKLGTTVNNKKVCLSSACNFNNNIDAPHVFISKLRIP